AELLAQSGDRRPRGCWRSHHAAIRILAVAHGNRTHRTRLSARATGFEDRAGHQIRTRYRRGIYQVSSWGQREKRARATGAAGEIPARLLRTAVMSSDMLAYLLGAL